MGDRGRGRPRLDTGTMRPIPEYGMRSGGRGIVLPGPTGPHGPRMGAPSPRMGQQLSAFAASAAVAAAPPGGSAGRGAGPDHREVRYQEGVLLMINSLRLLTLGGPRTWDFKMFQQVGMQVAPRAAPGTGGREVLLLTNHFPVVVRANTLVLYDMVVHRTAPPTPPTTSSTTGEAASSVTTPAPLDAPMPLPLLWRVLEGAAAEAGWSCCWTVAGPTKLLAAQRLLPQDEFELAVQLDDTGAHWSPAAAFAAAGSGAAAGGAAAAAGGSASSTPGAVKVAGDGVLHAAGSYTVKLKLQTTVDLACLKPRPGSAAPEGSAAGGPGAPPVPPPPPPPPPAAADKAAPDLLAGLQNLLVRALAGYGTYTAPVTTTASASAHVAPAMGRSLSGSLPPPAPLGGFMGGGVGQLGSSLGSGLLGGGGSLGVLGGGVQGMLAVQQAQTGTPGAAGGSSGVAGSGPPCRVVATGGPGEALIYPYNPTSADVRCDLGGGLEGVVGHSCRLQVTQQGLTLLSDVVAGAFLMPGPLPELLPQLLAVGVPGEESPGEDGAAAATAAAAAAAASGSENAANGPAKEEGTAGEATGSSGGAGAADATAAAAAAAAAAALKLPLTEAQKQLVEDSLRGAEVLIRCSGGPMAGRHACVRAVSAAGADITPASSEVGAPTVAEQWQAQHGVTLLQPQLPCLDVGSGAAPEWVPAELCSVLPLSSYPYRLLSEQQQQLLGKLASKKVPDRKLYLETQLGLKERVAADASVVGFGLEVAPVLASTRARILPGPHLAYASPECLNPGTQGQWNLRTFKAPGGSKITSWALVALMPAAEVVCEGPSSLDTFLKDLVACLGTAGVEASVPPVVTQQPELSVLEHLQEGAKAAQQQYNAPPELLLVLTRSHSKELYQEIKVASDAVMGVPSQTLVAGSAGVGAGVQPRGRLQYMGNIVLKINAKMGGINVRLAGDPQQVIPVVGARPFILFGASMCTAPSSTPGPTATAVVASRDRSLGRYSCRLGLQPASSTSIENMQSAVRELLVDFYRQNTGRKPEAIIFYRTDVGTDVHDQVSAAEYAAIRRACADLEESYCPPITYVIASKAHRTRLFPADKENQDRSGNCLPGTVVDRDVCDSGMFDFYLNSHAGLQGHNKPAHYHVIVDENGFTADGLQLFTYWQCFLCCRCTRGISMATPAYYATLAAQRGQLLAGAFQEQEASGERPPSDVKTHVKLGGTMHYV